MFFHLQVPYFPVYTRSGEVSVSIDILKSDHVFTVEQLDRLKMFHKYLFANVLRLEKDPMDYVPDEAIVGYLVVPVYSEGKCNVKDKSDIALNKTGYQVGLQRYAHLTI